MPSADFTESDVKYLLKARKFIHRVKEDNREETRRNPNIRETRIGYEIRTKQAPARDIRLRFSARLEKPAASALVRPLPGVALFWYGRRIRGVSWAVRHEVVHRQLVTGYIKGWYEHQWTDDDEDRFIVSIQNEVKQTDLLAMVNFCLKRWNIETVQQLGFPKRGDTQ